MSNEEKATTVRHSFKVDEENPAIVHEVFAAEVCTGKCPTCQETCELTAGHQGMHHCPAGHEWV